MKVLYPLRSPNTRGTLRSVILSTFSSFRLYLNSLYRFGSYSLEEKVHHSKFMNHESAKICMSLELGVFLLWPDKHWIHRSILRVDLICGPFNLLLYLFCRVFVRSIELFSVFIKFFREFVHSDRGGAIQGFF